MLKEHLLGQLQRLLADAGATRSSTVVGPSLMTLAGGYRAASAAAVTPLMAAGGPLRHCASTGAASTSGRPAIGGALLPYGRRLWAAATTPSGRRHWRHSQLIAALNPAGEQWPADGQPSANPTRQVARASAVQRAAQVAVVIAPSQHTAQVPLEPPTDALYSDRWSAGRVNGAQSSRPAAAAGAEALLSVQGTVQKVTFRSADTGYTVFRFQLTAAIQHDAAAAPATATGGPKMIRGGRRQVITVVGNLPQVAVGQSLLLRGTWVEHWQYGEQLRALDLTELKPANDGEMAAYLGGGAIPGVGPVTAQRMIERWGGEIEAKLNSEEAVSFLEQCEGIGAAKAQKIKKAWDESEGTREGVRFLKEHNIPLHLAQRIAQRWGPRTVNLVRSDPYAALAGFGLPFSKVDLLASKVGASPDLVSRAAMAVQQCLAAAAAEAGHVYLPWHRLERDCTRLLREASKQLARPWLHDDALHLVAQHMHAAGTLVAEPAATPETEAAGAAGAAGAGAEEAAVAAEHTGKSAAAQVSTAQVTEGSKRQHPLLYSIDSLKDYLGVRMPDLSDSWMQAMVSRYGMDLLGVLDAQHASAVEQLSKCRRIGPKTAEKIKLAWEASYGGSSTSPNSSSSGSSSSMSGTRGTAGLTMSRLLDTPPQPGFPWGPSTRCYPPHMHEAEVLVAQCSLQRSAAYKQPTTRQLNRVRKWVAANQSATDIQLSEGQVRAIEVASDAPLMVVTGGPGCGKTTVVQTIVKLWRAQRKIVRIAAPTGRAAQRMGEIQHIEPCTIHRLLGYQPRRSTSGTVLPDGGAAEDEAELAQGHFTYHRGNPLPADAVLVDEASMLNLPLAAALFEALRPGCQLVLVGDVDQLPPVGAGAVLQDLLASRLVPVVDLREIFRQAAQSAIITSALAVRRGEVPLLEPVHPTAAALAGAGSDALQVGAGYEEQLVEAVRETVCALRQAGDIGQRGGGQALALGQDLQVISPMRKGPAGTAILNRMLQALLNPPARDKAEVPQKQQPHSQLQSQDGEAPRVFRVGDRVLQLQNDYDKNVFNGDQGQVVACDAGNRQLTVHFPHLDKQGGDGQRSYITYQGGELQQLELAYAITVHKAQGGEADQVVLALSSAHGRMLSRRLLYTALTRARRQLVVVTAGGDPLAVAVQRQESDARLTWLQVRLEAGRETEGLPQLEPQCFSNEDQMLAQAAQWRQQQQQHMAQQQRAEANEAVGWVDSRAARGSRSNDGSMGSSGSSGSNGNSSSSSSVVPLLDQLAAAQAHLQQSGCSAEEAAHLLDHLQQRAPEALHDVDRAMAALDWLLSQPQLAGRQGVRDVLLRAPGLLALEVPRLQRCWQFHDRMLGSGAQPGQLESVGSSDGGSNSILAELHALRSAAMRAQEEQQEVHQQQQAAAV